jgi:hypothetical protein
MATKSQEAEPTHHSLVRGGLSYRLAWRFGFEPPTLERRLTKVVLLVVVTWVPLVVLSFLRGHAWGHAVAEPLLLDPVVYSRFLFVVPLLELAQVVVERSLGVQMQHFVDSGLLPEQERPKFLSAQDTAIRLRDSYVAELLLLILSVMIPLPARQIVGVAVVGSSWQRVGTTITFAGWWYILVSMPILLFFLLRWGWIFVLWAWFLFRVSRLDLKLTATHPDHAGGLGFLGWGLASFSPIVMAVAAVLSGSFAREIIHHDLSLGSLKYHILVFVLLAIVILQAPLLAFAGKQARCRFRGLLDFGTLIWRHDCEFDEKWIKTLNTSQESLLGNPDTASLARMDNIYAGVEKMRLIPLDKKAMGVLVLAALLPMLPLVGTAIPLKEILSKLGRFMV